MPISYYNPKQSIRLSAYADTIVLEPDGREQRLRAIRFGGYPEMVRAMSDAIYAGATLEAEIAGETVLLACEPKKYERHLSHDGIYAEATILSLDEEDSAQEQEQDGQTAAELPPRKCVLFCPAGDRRALFEALDRKTSVPLIPEFQDYVLDELQRRRFLKPLRVISIRERLEAWLLLCKKDDANIVKVLEDGLKSGTICIPGTVQNPRGFDGVHSVTSYLSAFGVTVAERIRNQFRPLFDPAAEQLSPEILRINDYIRAHAGYSLYPAQLAVAESVKRKLSEGKSAFIVAECGSGKTKIGAAALAAHALKMDFIRVNPMNRVKKPKPIQHNANFYSAEEAEKLIAAVHGDTIEFPVMMAAYYGLRRSEIAGLRWRAIDFKSNRITIERTVTQAIVDGERKIIAKDRAKNKSSCRSLPLMPQFKKILLQMKQQQETNRKLCGNCYHESEYVYVNPLGVPYTPDFITDHFRKYLKKAGFRKITFHELRHSCASMLLKQGVGMKDIQAWLGHSTYNTTANLYAHLDSESKVSVGTVMENLLDLSSALESA